MTLEYILGAITTTVGLFVTQGLITNGTEKIITGLASVLVPLVIIGAQALLKSQAHKAKVQAAIANRGQV